MKRLSIGLATGLLGVTVTLLSAESNQPSPELEPETPEVSGADACLERLPSIFGQINALENEARESNQAVRLQCLLDKQLQLEGLNRIARSAHSELESLDPAEDPEAMEAEAEKIHIACERAAQVLAEARSCQDVAPVRTRRKRQTVAALTAPSPSAGEPWVAPQRRRVVDRHAQDCLSQGRLACLVVQAMELHQVDGRLVEGCVQELQQREIKPLQGWQVSRCVTLDDLAAVLTSVLELSIDHPEDPLSHLQALRQQGLAVDLLLPSRAPAPEPPPLLLESEVRRFLAAGWGAPLGNSRNPTPD